MTVSTYEEWVADGQPWHPCQPAADLRATLERHGFTVFTLGDEGHLTANPPEDHTPYSHTPWPGTQPYPAVLAIDVTPGGSMDWRDLAARIVADKNAGVPGTQPIKYINWTDRSGNCWHETWEPDHARTTSSDQGHIHLSFRTDYATSHVMSGYDPVTGSPPTPPAPPWPGRELRLTDPPMTGDDVRTWQQRMHDRGWTIDVDGRYGPQSESVCRRFQQDSTDHGWPLTVDGIVGPNTWRAAWERPIT